jgi:hypothetical protein
VIFEAVPFPAEVAIRPRQARLRLSSFRPRTAMWFADLVNQIVSCVGVTLARRRISETASGCATAVCHRSVLGLRHKWVRRIGPKQVMRIEITPY